MAEVREMTDLERALLILAQQPDFERHDETTVLVGPFTFGFSDGRIASLMIGNVYLTGELG